MSAEFLSSLLAWGVLLIAALIAGAFMFYWFYRRSTKEMAFVRSGLGGQKVVINGGALVIPIIHAGRVLGVLDLDSPRAGRFDEGDAQGLEALVQAFLESTDLGG